MPTFTIKSVPSANKYILTQANYNYTQPPQDTNKSNPRQQSQLHTLDYQRSLRRAFSRAKLLAFFNPDLNQFITLTYKQNNNTPQQVQQDIKNLIKQHNRKYNNHNPAPLAPRRTSTTTPLEIVQDESVAKRPRQLTISPLQDLSTNGSPASQVVVKSTTKPQLQGVPESIHKKTYIKPFKYIYVMEYQKRGSIHVHMVANDALDTHTNKNGYPSITGWSHGFSSVLTIKDFDENFKPFLYLFKYMHKAERIGSSFIHTSRNFDKIEKLDYAAYIQTLQKGKVLFKEDFEFILHDTPHRITKEYIELV